MVGRGSEADRRTPFSDGTRFALDVFARLYGLHGHRGFAGVVVLAPCCDVHTLGMAEPIDVAFVDTTGLVVEVHRAVAPGKRMRNRRAVSVMERFSRLDAPWFEPGDRVTLAMERSEDEDMSGVRR